MNRAGEAQLSSSSDQNDAPRLGLLQCPNAESLGWAPSEPNSTVTSCAPSDDDEVMPTSLSSNNLNSPQSKTKSTAANENEQFHSMATSLKRQRLNPSEEKATNTATPDAHVCTNDGGAIKDPQSDLSHTQQNDTPNSIKLSNNTTNAVTAVLDYDTNSSDSLQDDGKRCCQILTITLTPSLNGNKDDLANASILVGTISGKVKLEVLPQTTESESSSSVSLDVFGYRISCNTSSGKDNSITIDRPDWMNSLPLTLITNGFCLDDNTSSYVLRVKLHSIHDENDTSKQTSNDEDYYSAYAEETYNMKALSPNYIYPGNHTLCGLGVTVIMEQWETTLDALAKNVLADDNLLHNRKMLICGAKGCGKSTMLRYATNRVLSEQHRNNTVTKGVAILDLDCGQPELSVPGLVTLNLVSEPLLSDPPMHMVCSGEMNKSDNDGLYCPQQLGAYFFRDITSKSDPDKYIEMASLLLQRYHDMAKKWIDEGMGNLPLLINTDGWVKGFGYEILCAILEAVNPRNIIQILGATKTKSFELPPQNVAEDTSRHRHVHAVQSFDENMIMIPNDDCRSYRSMDSSNSTGPLQATASDHRTHRICVYFMGGYKKMINKQICWLGRKGEAISFHREKGVLDPNSIIGLTMAAMSPYAAPFHSVSLYLPPAYLDGVEEVESTFGTRGDHASEDALDALNGSIVGLCCGMDSTPNSSSVPNLHCVGLGIIRSIDREHKLFFVLTPVHPSLLSNVTVFVGGSIGLPLEIVFRGVHADSFPFLSEHSLATPSLGGDVMKSRNHSGRKKN